MKKTITYWLIRHKPSGGYLPDPRGRMGRGGSWVEPVIFNPDDSTTEPRICTTKRSAQGVLTQWLRGKVHHSSGWEEDYFSGGREYYEELEIEHVPSRIKEDMEIISVDLIIP